VSVAEDVLERKGCPLHYWTAGSAGGPLVVFTHGACVDHHTFDSCIPALADHYRVLAWDVRGHGASQPMGARFTVPLGAEDLLALLDRAGYEQAVLVGHSNGSYISQELAFRHPERVQALVIADGTCITWRHNRLAMLALSSALAAMAVLPFETLKTAGLKSNVLQDKVRDYVYRAYSRISKRDFVAILRGALECLHYEPGYRISQPLLLTHGDEDRMGDIRRIAPLWARREPYCRYVVIPRARHFAILDNPDFFNGLLQEFLHTWVPPEPGRLARHPGSIHVKT
jgi:pimeloyl-ACP methyl ester carboxylesterase